MNRRPPLIPYTFALHTGNTTWGTQKRPWSLTPAAWVTCNGQPVDLTTMGFPRAYTAPDMAAYLADTVMARRERMVRTSNIALAQGSDAAITEAVLHLLFSEDTP